MWPITLFQHDIGNTMNQTMVARSWNVSAVTIMKYHRRCTKIQVFYQAHSVRKTNRQFWCIWYDARIQWTWWMNLEFSFRVFFFSVDWNWGSLKTTWGRIGPNAVCSRKNASKCSGPREPKILVQVTWRENLWSQNMYNLSKRPKKYRYLLRILEEKLEKTQPTLLHVCEHKQLTARS